MNNPEQFHGDPSEQETLTNPEINEITDNYLIESLRKGIENQEVAEVLQKWCEQEEQKNSSAEDQVKFNIRRNQLYAEAGYIEEAIDGLYEDLEQAENEGLETLTAKIKEEIKRLA